MGMLPRTVRAFVGRFLRAHALLVAALVVASLISAVVYELTGGGGPKSRERDAPRLNLLSLAGDKPAARWTDEDFECLGWRATHNCDPYGPRDVARDRGCNATMPRTSGFCEVRNRTSGEVLRVMLATCKSWQWSLVPALSCQDARQFTDFSVAAAAYRHPPPKAGGASTGFLLPQVHDDKGAQEDDDDKALIDAALAAAVASRRGIVLVAYPKVIAGVYAIVRTLRSHGCLLPVELWIDPMEMRPRHSVLQELVRRFHCVVRVIHDPHATKFHAKPYAIYHSRFESVLFLDSDNIPVRDPTYLFESPEFRRLGAIFWPDFWRPMVRTPFNVHEQSALWRLLDMPFTDMFEQESGQILVNRSRSHDALSKLMFYSAHLPRLITDWQLVWGDKDLFRLAWLNTSTPFHMVQHLVMLGGLYSAEEDTFCGVSMVQRDPAGDVLFMHRNQAKLSGKPDDLKVLITHIQKFTGGDGTARSLPTELDMYRVKSDFRKLGQYTCFSIHQMTRDGATTPYLIQSLDGTRFPQVEKQAIHFSIEGRNLFTKSEEAEVRAIETREETKQVLETQLAEEEAARDRRRSRLLVVGGSIGIFVGGLLVLLLGRGGQKGIDGGSGGTNWWWWICCCCCCGLCGRRTRQRSESWMRSRSGSKVPTSPGVEVTVSVLPTTSSASSSSIESTMIGSSGDDEASGSSTSVVAVHGENRRRKTSFQVMDA